MAPRLGLGPSDFQQVREQGYAYLDKSLLIGDLVDDGAQSVLIPRPRRFGKTLRSSLEGL